LYFEVFILGFKFWQFIIKALYDELRDTVL